MDGTRLPTLYVPGGETNRLPDNAQWTNRFYIAGSSGNRYTVAQNKANRFWACSCRGFISHQNCKHLRSMGLPCYHKPYEVLVA